MEADKENKELLPTQKYDTCFFEKYAQIELATVLGHDFDGLVNLDRPDLQSPGCHTLGIEVTRAMEESKELPYWKMALPMRRILESKVSKVGRGFYGRFDRMGLFVFSKDNLGEGAAVKAMNYTISLQKYQDLRYNRLYIADVDDLFVCNLDEGLSASSRLARYRITQDQRRSFYEQVLEKTLPPEF